MDTVENNITETIAILLALETLPLGWTGTLYGDNLNSIRRAREPRKIKKVVPSFIREAMVAACDKVAVQYVLLGGHPTKQELIDGRRKDGAMVSKWNVMADKLCCIAAENHIRQQEITGVSDPEHDDQRVVPAQVYR